VAVVNKIYQHRVDLCLFRAVIVIGFGLVLGCWRGFLWVMAAWKMV
jgi:hypothetical protein